MKRLICFIAVMILTVTTASAQELDAYIAADEQTGNIAVSGKGAAYGGQLISILIAKDENGFFSPDAPLITEAVQADENGGYDVTIQPYLPLSGGEYIAKIATADNWISKKFIVISIDSAKQLYELLKECKSKSELGTLLEGRIHDAGLSQEDWLKYSTELTDRIYSGIKNCKDVSDFLKLCRTSLAIERIGAGDDIEVVLSETKNSMLVKETPIYDMYQALSQKARGNVMKLYTDGTDIAGAFAEACALAAVKSCKNWRELADVLSPLSKTVFSDVFSLDTSYCTSNNADGIIGQLYGRLSSLNSVKAVRDTFLTISKEYNSNNSGSGSGSSGGSGGSSFTKKWSDDGFAVAANNSVKKSFNDVEGHWGQRYIDPLAQRGIVKGYDDGGFHPDAYVTRAEFVKMICTGFDITGEYADTGFADVDKSAWYAQSVAVCRILGIVHGDTHNRFRPQERITREDASVILYRILEDRIAFSEAERIPFNDSADIADYAVDAVSAMTDEGILSGFDTGSFRPKENTTRAQAAAILIRALDLLNAES